MGTYNRPNLHKKENPIMEEHNKKLREALAETLKQRRKEEIHNARGKCSFADCEKCNK
ncbi:MAG: hypothetical protein WC644_04370 [Ignavibacteria bacterium]